MRRSTSEVGDDRSGMIEHAGASIRAFVEACGYTDKLLEQRALGLWSQTIREYLGPEAEHFSDAVGIRDGELIVGVAKPAWRHRLTFELPVMIRLLNDQLGADIITSIRLK